MAFSRALCVLLVFHVFAVAASIEWPDDEEREIGPEEDAYLDEHERKLAMELRSLREQRIKAFECNNLGESCRGVVPCCGTLQCYWKAGYSLKTTGECVECVKSGQLCQRDKQCCSSLVCQKDSAFYVDGRCDSPRAAGGECHEDDQCSSKNCRISVWKKMQGYGGTCA